MNASPWWRRDLHAARRPRLLARNRIKAALRSWFEARDFIEVEAASLQRQPAAETHLHAFATASIAPDGERSPLYLHTSPEFACKKLLAAGERRIFDFARVWRNRERGPLHHPEFTLLEWYRAEETYDRLMIDAVEMLRLAAACTGVPAFRFRNLTCEAQATPERLTVAEAFYRFAGIDLLATIGRNGAGDVRALVDAAQARDIRIALDDTWSDVFSRVLVQCVEPHLGSGSPTLLCEYPTVEAALARPCAHDPRVAERFELFVCGVELANAFGELTDPAEQRRRLQAELDEKARVYGERFAVDETFITALAQMPPASGAALGFDRLVMLATGAAHIEEVLWTPVPETARAC